MKLEYLLTAEAGGRWLREYYKKNPQLSFVKMREALRATEMTLCSFPFSGERFEERDDVREINIHGSNFSLLYTVARETIWTIDIRDQRGYRSAEALRSFTRELRQRFGLAS